ncbi:hypothetical protein ACIU1J_29420 [Azospirillum doebereinerae]|nr:hypothetical protein [Azospirillum doebereinerae]
MFDFDVVTGPTQPPQPQASEPAPSEPPAAEAQAKESTQPS